MLFVYHPSYINESVSNEAAYRYDADDAAQTSASAAVAEKPAPPPVEQPVPSAAPPVSHVGDKTQTSHTEPEPQYEQPVSQIMPSGGMPPAFQGSQHEVNPVSTERESQGTGIKEDG